MCGGIVEVVIDKKILVSLCRDDLKVQKRILFEN